MSSDSPYKVPRKKDPTGTPAYYIYNVGGENGYVIVSGDSRTPEILGYVDHGSFDENNLPENMQSLLQLYADEIQSLDDADSPQTSARLKANIKYTRHSIAPLIKSQWNQGEPYNLMCPDYYKEDGTTGRPASGCVATAFAQIINFYKYPAQTVSTIPSLTNTYTLSNGTQKTVTAKAIAKTDIDWANMCEVYSGDETEEQRMAVAKLMLLCGQSVKMGYGASSGAYTDQCRDAIVKHFGFDDSAVWLKRSDYDVDDWIDILYNEIAEGYPIEYSGYSTGGGHAFVIDGYDGYGLFHVNWGWGGSSDGWFIVTSLNPGDNSGMGASSTADGYSMGQGALLHVRLPDDVKAESTTALTLTNVTCNYASINASFRNETGGMSSFVAGMLYLDEETQSLTQVGIAQNMMSVPNGETRTYTINMKGRLPEGSYRLTPASRLTTNRTWRPAYDVKREYILANYDNAGNVTLEHIQRSVSLAADTIIFPGNCQVNNSQGVQVTFRNMADEFYGEMSLFVATGGMARKKETRTAVSVAQGGTTTVSFNFTPDTEGLYDIWICDNDGKVEYAHTTVDITSEASTPANLTVTNIVINNSSSSKVYGNRLEGYATIRNVAKQTFDGRVKIRIWEQGDKDNRNVYWQVQSKTVELNIQPSKSERTYFQFIGLNYDRHYYIVVDYVDQEGSLNDGGLWNNDHYYALSVGAVYWGSDGTMGAASLSSSFNTPRTAAGVYLNGFNLNSLSANPNPNTIYVFADNTALPSYIRSSNDHVNIVHGSQADTIVIANDNPYYVPFSFRASTGVFNYTFAEDTDGTAWKTFMVPFEPQTLSIDDEEYAITGEDNHFWIYEFAYTGNDGMPVFTPVTRIKAQVPYLIAADASLAGKTLRFAASDVDFYRTGDVNNIVNSDIFRLQVASIQERITGAYHLNAAGTAFEYSDKATNTTAQQAYFILNEPVPAELLTTSIPLPEVPSSPTAIALTKEEKLDLLQPVYTLDGRRVGTATSSGGTLRTDGLAPGLYIVGGRKIIVK